MLFTLFVLGFLVHAPSVKGEPNCSHNPCKNEGKCKMPPGSKQVVCECAFGFSGPTCEIPNRCTFRHVIKGMKDTSNVDILEYTGLKKEDVDECKQMCHNTIGCRAIEVKVGSCNTYQIIPISLKGVVEMNTERNRLYALRRCFKRKDPSVTAAATESKSTPAEDKNPAEETATPDVESSTTIHMTDEL